MRGPQRFDCWRFRTWDAKLSRRRVALWKAEALNDADPTLVAPGEVWAKEARVNRALVKHAQWKKRACENCRSRVQRSKA